MILENFTVYIFCLSCYWYSPYSSCSCNAGKILIYVSSCVHSIHFAELSAAQKCSSAVLAQDRF